MNYNLKNGNELQVTNEELLCRSANVEIEYLININRVAIVVLILDFLSFLLINLILIRD